MKLFSRCSCRSSLSLAWVLSTLSLLVTCEAFDSGVYHAVQHEEAYVRPSGH